MLPSPSRALAATIAMAGVLPGCDLGLMSPEDPGALVPPTVAEDPSLPALTVTVEGHRRELHLRTWGDPADPVLLALPGGPGADFRLLLPLQELGDGHRVVMWDPRGAGLSERVTEEELTIDGFVDEVRAVHDAVAAGRRVTLIGHSLGAGVMLRYAATHPGRVDRLLLLEPGPLTEEGEGEYDGGMVGFGHGQDFFWQNEVLSSQDHAAADYKAVSLLPEALRTFTCSGEPPAENPMWRFGAYQYHVVLHRMRSENVRWAEGIEAFDGPVTIIAGTCGAASAEFQLEHNLEVLPGAELMTVPGAGHLSLFTSHSEETLALVRARLNAGGVGGQP